MRKQAVSVTLDRENILWLRARALASPRRSLSDALDHLISEARTMPQGHTGAIRYVVGSIRLSPSDPDLLGADAALRTLFNYSLSRGSAQ